MTKRYLILSLTILANACGFGNVPPGTNLDGGGTGMQTPPDMIMVVTGPTLDASLVPNELVLVAGELGGSGTLDGNGTNSRFDLPIGVAVDTTGNVYVAEAASNTIRKLAADGTVTTIAGFAGQSGTTDGVGTAVRFDSPSAVAVDTTGNVYVADTNNQTIRKIAVGGAVSTFAGQPTLSGSANGVGTAATFYYPAGIAIDSAGHIFVSDQGNNAIRKILVTGTVSTFAGTPGSNGATNGSGAAARFNTPGGIAIDASNNLYVADVGNNLIREISSTAVVTTLAGASAAGGSTNGAATVATFSYPTSVGVDANGNVFVADRNNEVIRKISGGNVTTFAGTFGMRGHNDDPSALFNHPSAVVIDPSGNAFVADASNNLIRKISSAGATTTVAGLTEQQGSTDGGGSKAQFYFPNAIAIATDGTIFVADTYNQAVRKIVDGQTSLYAGVEGSANYTDGPGVSAQFNFPYGITVDTTGNVYVGDTDNNAIRKIATNGFVTTLAGNGNSGADDGVGTGATFFGPTGLAIDSNSNIYVADFNSGLIRQVTLGGAVTTIAGMPGVTGAADGNGGNASFFGPGGVAVDATGNLYVADTNNNTVRFINTNGDVSTLAGTAGMMGAADGTGPAALFHFPVGVAVDANGNVFVADYYNGAVRKITSAGVVTTVIGTLGQIGVTLGALPGTLNTVNSLNMIGNTIYMLTENSVLAATKTGGF